MSLDYILQKQNNSQNFKLNKGKGGKAPKFVKPSKDKKPRRTA